MPVRITPEKSLLISYDTNSKSWVTLEGLSICLLSQYVDIEPGVTLQNVFDLIDQDTQLKKFLSEYCSCNIDSIRKQEPRNQNAIQVITQMDQHAEGYWIATSVADIDQIVVRPFFYVYTEESTNERKIDGTYMLYGVSSKHEGCATGLSGPNKYVFRQLKDYEIRLDSNMEIFESDEDKIDPDIDEETIAFSAKFQYTLFDFLTTVVDFFGSPVFDSRYQKQIDEELEMIERFRKRNEKDSSSDE